MRNIEELNILKEVEGQRTGTHYIKTMYKQMLKEQLHFLKEHNILADNNMTYTFIELDNKILLCLYRPIIVT